MLVLFDIDGTLLSAGGVGARAMTDAGQALFGPAFTLDGVEIAGRLDPLIWADAAAQCGVAHDTHHDRFRSTYRDHLARRLENDGPVQVMPGVEPLLQALQELEGVCIGLLTGNYPETGRMKIAAAGLGDAEFVVNAFGSDAPQRRDLPPVAMQRYHDAFGRPIEAERVVIIGDTPHDVDCALAHGCRSLAVATGRSTVGELTSCGADRTVEDLSATGSLVDWITES
ncbi:MAG: HAD family hydrolase [Planctomycetota bacterium]|jgi:phosphoglycolate phosphatase-like HAD superfamily hydrolase